MLHATELQALFTEAKQLSAAIDGLAQECEPLFAQIDQKQEQINKNRARIEEILALLRASERAPNALVPTPQHPLLSA